MILYHAVSTYQLLCMILHKLKYHRGESATIIIASLLCDKYGDLARLNTVFEKYCIYDCYWEVEGGSVGKKYCNYLEKILRDNEIVLEECTEINVGGAHLLFGVYLATHGICFNYFEDASGLLSREGVLLDNESLHQSRRDLCESLKLYNGMNKYVQQIYCDYSAQDDAFIVSNKMVDINVSRELFEMDAKKRLLVQSIFVENTMIDIPKNCVVFLTQHFCNLGLMSFEDNIEITKLVFDYFFSGENIVIKPHPDDAIYYKKLFQNYIVIRDSFPSEFLPYVFSNRPKAIATISSTAVKNLQHHYKDAFTFDFKFQRHFRVIHKYAYIVALMQFIGVTKEKLYGVDEMLLKNLSKTQKQDRIGNSDVMRSKKVQINIVDIIEEEKRKEIITQMNRSSEDELWLFINQDEEFAFYEYQYKDLLLTNLLPITLVHYSIGDNGDRVNREEIIYVYSKDRRILETVKGMNYEMRLERSNETVTVKQQNEYEIEIARLKGILAATEKRLLWYIKKDMRKWK